MADIVRENLAVLISPETRRVAMAESIGGNAGAACYALNLSVEPSGRIAAVGNAPERVNATLKVFVPRLAAAQTRLKEVAIELSGDLPEEARPGVLRSAWLWNLYREKKERPLLDRYLAGKIAYDVLVELLRSKYPKLARELSAP